MVIKIDGISEIGANVRSNLRYLTCKRLLFSSRAVACATCYELPSNISTMVLILYNFRIFSVHHYHIETQTQKTS